MDKDFEKRLIEFMNIYSNIDNKNDKHNKKIMLMLDTIIFLNESWDYCINNKLMKNLSNDGFFTAVAIINLSKKEQTINNTNKFTINPGTLIQITNIIKNSVSQYCEYIKYKGNFMNYRGYLYIDITKSIKELEKLINREVNHG